MAASFLATQDFFDRKKKEIAFATQLSALYLATGIDLAEALQYVGHEKLNLIARLRRMIERERMKGVRRHWSYDLNRHIALKQVYDLLQNGAVEQ